MALSDTADTRSIRWIRACRVTLGARSTRVGLGCGLLFAAFFLLYWTTRTRAYTFDAVSYALQIESYAETGEWRWMFHPHHLLFNGAGYIVYRLLQILWPDIGSLAALQTMNAIIGAGGILLFASIAGRICADRGAGFLAAAGLGLSYGYWTCSTDGRVNIPGVVVLVGALGAVGALLHPGLMRSRRGGIAWAAALGLLNLLALLLHQSHILLAPAALLALSLSPGRSYGRKLAAYLVPFLGLGSLAYAVAGGLAAGARAPLSILRWSLTYAEQGQWWSLDVLGNLERDIQALAHALVARPELSGASPDGRLHLSAALLTVGVLAAAGILIARLRERFRGTAGEGEVAPPDADDVPRATGTRVGPGFRRYRRRMLAVLLVWAATYAGFFTIWNPGYFVFWVPLLVPLWLMAAFGLAVGSAALANRPECWIPGVAVLGLLAVNNTLAGIAPHACATNNGRLQKALAVRANICEGDLIVLAGAGDDAEAEVYLPYFARCEALSLNTLLMRSPTRTAALEALDARIRDALAQRRKVFVFEELLSLDAPYAELDARFGLTRREMLDFLHRHYRLGRPVRWQRRVGDVGLGRIGGREILAPVKKLQAGSRAGRGCEPPPMRIESCAFCARNPEALSTLYRGACDTRAPNACVACINKNSPSLLVGEGVEG